MDISEYSKADDNRVPFIVYEGTIARFERTVRRLIIVLAVTILRNVSAFTNDAGYLTAHQDISGKSDKTDTDIDASVITLFTSLGWTAT